MTALVNLELTGSLPSGRVVVDASAGTGKTYSLSALVVRFIVEESLRGTLEVGDILVVTFTRAAAAELRERIRLALVEARDLLNGTRARDNGSTDAWLLALLTDNDGERDQRIERINAAVASFDDATITTIHAFCQQALRTLGLRSGTPVGAELGDSTAELVDEVCRDLVINALWIDPACLDWPDKDSGPEGVLSRLIETVKGVLNNPGARREPSAATREQVTFPKFGKGDKKGQPKDTKERLSAWVDLVEHAVTEVGTRRARRHELGYDDLIARLHAAIKNETTGPAVLAMLRERYRLVLVDESQDTDPLQWEIFDLAFGDSLITVGDPKQAIYRFRGADVNTYLKVVERPDVTRLGLSTNFRSDVDLVTATNALIAGVELGHSKIAVTAVEAAPKAPKRSVSVGAPIEVRRLPVEVVPMEEVEAHFEAQNLARKKPLPPAKPGTKRYDEEQAKKKEATARRPSVPMARRAIVADLVSEVVSLLSGPTIDNAKKPERPVDAGDIAVLVPAHTEASMVVNALHRAGVPAVRTRTGSVLKTEATLEWKMLLSALEQFSHAPTVRAAALGVFFRRSAADLDPLADDADDVLADLQRTCAEWAESLANQPLLAWYDSVRSSSHVVPGLLAELGGERMLTDLDHIAELLAAELGGAGNSASAVLRVLHALEADATDNEDSPQMRRIDSDARAVQVTTLHGSKGLQYPIVLLPFCWNPRDARMPHVYTDVAGNRVIDLASGQEWNGPTTEETQKGRKHLAAVETRADDLRLLYVGLTRAEHRTIIWYAPTDDSGKSALSAVLFDRDDEGNPRNEHPSLGLGPQGGVTTYIPSFAPHNDEAKALLDVLVARSGGLISHTEIGAFTRVPHFGVSADDASGAPLAVADAGDTVVADPWWRRWSFSGITAAMHDARPVGGGHDEGDTDEDLAPDDDADAAARASAFEPSVRMPWAGLVGSAQFGVLVHEVLQRLDPVAGTTAALRSRIESLVNEQVRRSRIGIDASLIVDGLVAAVETPLGPIANGRRLADIPISDRLAELTFDLPLLDARTHVAARRIGEVLLDTLPDHDAVRPYAHQLADGRFDHDLAGFMQGSIDALLRVAGPDGVPQFVVVDYKTNRLHKPTSNTPIEAYHPDRLINGMVRNDYPLQALLYSVAVHRFLGWRMPSYDPHVHLGGIAYLFVRGMVGATTPTDSGKPDGRIYGVFTWQPPASAIVALDALFSPGGDQ